MKTLPEILSKYSPDDETRALLLSAEDVVVKADKEARALQIIARFPRLIPKETLYRIEGEVEAAYELNYVKFLPKYPSALYSDAYIPELLRETERVGIVARGFFSTWRHHVEGDVLVIEIPFIREGVMLLVDAHTPEIMQRILKSEFDIDVRIEIRNSEDMQGDFEARYQKRMDDMDARLAEASREYERSLAARQESAAPPKAAP